MYQNPPAYQPPAPPKKKVRVFTWVILVINVLFLIWVVGGAGSAAGTPENCGTLDAQTCNDAESVGTAIGVFLIVFLWALVDIILGVLWLVTRKRQPQVVYVAQPGYAPAGYAPGYPYPPQQ